MEQWLLGVTVPPSPPKSRLYFYPMHHKVCRGKCCCYGTFPHKHKSAVQNGTEKSCTNEEQALLGAFSAVYTIRTQLSIMHSGGSGPAIRVKNIAWHKNPPCATNWGNDYMAGCLCMTLSHFQPSCRMVVHFQTMLEMLEWNAHCLSKATHRPWKIYASIPTFVSSMTLAKRAHADNLSDVLCIVFKRIPC